MNNDRQSLKGQYEIKQSTGQDGSQYALKKRKTQKTLHKKLNQAQSQEQFENTRISIKSDGFGGNQNISKNTTGPQNLEIENQGTFVSIREPGSRGINVDTSIQSTGRMKLQNANFELGSRQFDVPIPNYNDEEISNIKSASPIRRMLNSKLRSNKPQAQNASTSKLPSELDKQALFDPAALDHAGQSNVIRTLTKYVTAKYRDEVSVKVLLEQRKMKDRIFDNIFSQFSKGQKLQRYDELREMEDLRKKLSDRNNQQNDGKALNAKKKKKEENEKQIALLKEAADAKEREKNENEANFMRGKLADDATAKKKFQIQSVREAVANKQMTVDEANEILLATAKKQDQKAFKDLRQGPQTKEFHDLLRKVGRSMRDMNSRSRSRRRSVERRRENSPSSIVPFYRNSRPQSAVAVNQKRRGSARADRFMGKATIGEEGQNEYYEGPVDEDDALRREERYAPEEILQPNSIYMFTKDRTTQNNMRRLKESNSVQNVNLQSFPVQSKLKQKKPQNDSNGYTDSFAKPLVRPKSSVNTHSGTSIQEYQDVKESQSSQNSKYCYKDLTFYLMQHNKHQRDFNKKRGIRSESKIISYQQVQKQNKGAFENQSKLTGTPYLATDKSIQFLATEGSDDYKLSSTKVRPQTSKKKIKFKNITNDGVDSVNYPRNHRNSDVRKLIRSQQNTQNIYNDQSNDSRIDTEPNITQTRLLTSKQYLSKQLRMQKPSNLLHSRSLKKQLTSSTKDISKAGTLTNDNSSPEFGKSKSLSKNSKWGHVSNKNKLRRHMIPVKKNEKLVQKLWEQQMEKFKQQLQAVHRY